MLDVNRSGKVGFAGRHARVRDGATGSETFGLHAFSASFTGGILVAGPPAARQMSIETAPDGATP